MSPCYTELPIEVILEKKSWREVETEKFGTDYHLEDILSWGVMDYNRFKSERLTYGIEEFLKLENYSKLVK